MHMKTAGQLKGITKKELSDKPREGSRVREVYDLFYDNKGKVVDFCTTDHRNMCLNTLIDTYGLDIRRIKKNKWCLVGEWFGKVYVDYTKP
jgi:hypothetical protein